MSNPAERGTRDRILEVAEACLGEHGYHGTRLHDITRQVGIQKASLFHYFPSKEQLYRAVLEEGVEQLEETVRHALAAEGGPREKLRALIEAYVDVVAQHPSRTKILLRQSLEDMPTAMRTGHSERLLRHVAEFIEAGQKTKLFAPIDPVALVLDVVGMVAFLFTSAPLLAPGWLRDPTSSSAVAKVKEHVLQVVERCLLRGGRSPEAACLSSSGVEGRLGESTPV